MARHAQRLPADEARASAPVRRAGFPDPDPGSQLPRLAVPPAAVSPWLLGADRPGSASGDSNRIVPAPLANGRVRVDLQLTSRIHPLRLPLEPDEEAGWKPYSAFEGLYRRSFPPLLPRIGALDRSVAAPAAHAPGGGAAAPPRGRGGARAARRSTGPPRYGRASSSITRPVSHTRCARRAPSRRRT